MLNQSHMFKKYLSLFAMLFLFGALSGCMQGKAATDIDYTFATADGTIEPSDNTIKLVNAVFYKNFIGGDWRFKGSARVNDTINAYIQIPQQLQMSLHEQENYLKGAICPSSQNKALWEEIKGNKLAVHIYTHKRKYSTFVICENGDVA
ncbi:MAG: hypothetical protein NWQ54_23095 [Paraglaciecola sp.]|uniref:hypothetical protein n=1 Tax=Paraglaciecola sp. TaxID=1920173 RepID=UPI00274029F1|nr:hypothetical protein [Paraglaciecola sp.]MDP5032530.1 hypothetical protein [Paraglaciecola sp.]MDP5133782.1 hypothetical protein [Paraglaciecola sp.]